MAESQNTVVYRDIPGFPGYRAGDDGSIWSCWSRGGCGPRIQQPNKWRPLKQFVCTQRGYLGVNLMKSQSGKRMHSVHRLVLFAFVGPCPKKMECCHRDDDPTNNRLDNLRWDTRSANMRDRKGPHMRRCVAIRNPDVIKAICAEYATGKTSHEKLAKKYKIASTNTIGRVLREEKQRKLLNIARSQC